MAVLGRLLVSSAERLDLPDLLSLDSYAAGDWKYFLKGLVGDTKPFILKGFDVIDPGNAIGTQSCSIRVADSITFYPGSNSGSFFHGLQEGHPQAAPLVPELRKNAINYVYLTFTTFNTSVDTRAFWDPDKDGGVGGEFTQDINTESVLQVQINVSTGSFPANTIPIAKITVGPVVITAIEDARDLMFRLGSGGINPNPFNTYSWRTLPGSGFARQEPPTTMLAGGVNPFQGADKNILTLKEWMDAIMSKLRELGGTTYWYDDTSSFSIISNFYDSVATAFKSKGKWIHDLTTPGLLTWTEDIQIKMTSDPRTYIIRQGSEQLQNEQVMYLAMQRNLQFNVTDESVQWINGQVYVNTIGGAVGLFANLSKGDYIKKANDTIGKWVRVEEFYDAVNLGGSTTTAAGARSIRLGSPYLGVTGAEKGRYDKGVYLPGDVVVSDRNQAAIANTGGNFHWIALRSDTIENVGNIVTTNLSIAIDQHNGSTARVTSTAHGLVDGDRITITGTTNFNGTFQVEVETANIFYITISGGPFVNESGTARYATVTTAARVTPYGFQEESANHGFTSNETIILAGTTNYNGSYAISVRSSTSFTIPISAATATETIGTATLAKVIVRTEGAVEQLIQGQSVDIGGSVADNIRLYIGMDSLSQTAPIYAIAGAYNTLDGMQNYNSIVNENLTARVSKLTAMMADKAQDRTIQLLASNGITSVSNTTNGSAQELRFSPNGGSLTIATPSSDGQAFVALPGSSTPVSLLANQAAYVIIDRNNQTSPTISVANITSVPLTENVFILAIRINTPDIYIWDGSIITVGSQPAAGYLNTVVRQNQALKLIAGGIWSYRNSAVLSSPAPVYTHTALDTGNIINFGSGFLAGLNWITTSAFTVTSTVFRLNSTGATGNLVVKLYADAAGVPGTLLATSNPVNAATIGSSKQDITFTFAGTSLSNATKYYFIIDASGTTGGSNITLWGYSGDVDATEGLTFSLNSGASWSNSIQDIYTIISGSTLTTVSQLVWTANANIQIPGLANSVNVIPAGNVTINSGDVAYVDINRVGPGGSLTVTVAQNSTLAMTTNRFIIAREDSGGVVVGAHSMLLVAGESKKLYAGASNETLGAVGLISEVDKGPLRILQPLDGASKRVILTPIDNVVFDGTTWGNEISGLRMKFAGLQIDMQTGQYYAYGDGTLAGSGTLIGSAFTPTSFTNPNVYRWYSINLVADVLNADGTMNVKPLILKGTDGSSSALAVKAPFSSKKIGQVLVQATGTGLVINNVVQTNVVQLASGAGSGGGSGAPKLIGGGTFSWDIATTTLSFTANMFVEQPRLNYADNTISTASGPFILSTVNHVAYIDRLNASSGGSNLTVLVDLITNVKDGQIIIARRDGNDAIVGSTSNRLRSGESAKLFANRSNFDNQQHNAKVIEGGIWSWAATPANVNPVNNSDTTGATAGDHIVTHTAGFWSAYKFTVAATTVISNVALYLQRGGGTGNVTMLLTSDTGSAPGSVLYTSAPIAVSSISNSVHTVTNFVFTSATLAPGNYTVYIPAFSGVVLTTPGYTTGTNANTPYYATANNGVSYTSASATDYIVISGIANSIFQLSNSASAFIQIPGLPKVRNTIPTSVSPITLTDGQVAYTSINRSGVAATNLAITVADQASVPTTDDIFVVASCEVNEVLIGNPAMRLVLGESKKLLAGVSNQLLSVIPAASAADNTGIARLLANSAPNTSVNVTSSGKIVPDGTTYGLQLKNLLMSFTGASIDFATGIITNSSGGALGLNFTPATVASGQFRWYSVTLVPNTVQSDNTITGQIIVIAATADGASTTAAPKAAFASTGIKLGQIVVQGNGATINAIAQTSVIQMSTGGSGAGGTGDANELLERLKDRLNEAPFEWLTPNIFNQDAQTKIASATATYDVANSFYKFSAAGQNIVSTQSLDPEFLSELRDVVGPELIAFWNPGAIDANAIYEVSRNGGATWNTMIMNRVGTTTDTFRGILNFPVDTSWSILHEWPVANATAYRELNTTALQAIAQPFIITTGEEAIQQPILYINKVGSPTGTTYVQLVKDDGAGKPSTNISDIIAQTQVFNSNLTSGDNALTLAWGTNIVAVGTYHYVISTDLAYKAAFNAGFTSVRARVDATAPIAPQSINELISGVWTLNSAQSLIYTVNGRIEDLRVRITSSVGLVQLLGYGVFYGRQDNVINGIKNREVQSFNGTTNNFNTFTVTNFLPDPDLIRIYHVETGQVYVPGVNGFALNGSQIIFPANTFNGLGTVTLVFDQILGGSYDNSDANGALLAANSLGSTNASLDRSQSGRGIFLRRPDGTLREITIDNNDNIVVYSV